MDQLPTRSPDNLIWIDLEFTNLDPASAYIMQAAMIVTTADLVPIPPPGVPLEVGGLLFEEGRRRAAAGGWRRVLFWALAGLAVASAAWEVRTTLALQVRNGIVVYGEQARLAKRVAHYASSLGIPQAVVYFPVLSPTVAAYVEFPVVFDKDYARRLVEARPNGAVFVIDKRRALTPLLERAPLTVLEETGGWALALLRPPGG